MREERDPASEKLFAAERELVKQLHGHEQVYSEAGSSRIFSVEDIRNRVEVFQSGDMYEFAVIVKLRFVVRFQIELVRVQLSKEKIESFLSDLIEGNRAEYCQGEFLMQDCIRIKEKYAQACSRELVISKAGSIFLGRPIPVIFSAEIMEKLVRFNSEIIGYD